MLSAAVVCAYAPPTTLAAPSALATALQAELNALTAANPDFAITLGWKSSTEELALSSGVVKGSLYPDGRADRPADPHDKFLFGSGTKPLTAAAVLRLADAGALSLDDPVSKHVDALLTAVNGTTLAGLFGAGAAAVTVGNLLAMQSGLADFDTPELDDQILSSGEDFPPVAILHAAASQSPPIHFAAGTQTEYSSTNYVLAGLVLLAHDPTAHNDWTQLHQHDLTFPPNLRAKYANVSFIADQPISSVATVAGASGMIEGKLTPIWAQKGGVLGFTCGNMAATALDVANFFYDLLVEKSVVSEESLAAMQQFNLLSYGWAKGHVVYGSGLMIESVAYTAQLWRNSGAVLRNSLTRAALPPQVLALASRLLEVGRVHGPRCVSCCLHLYSSSIWPTSTPPPLQAATRTAS